MSTDLGSGHAVTCTEELVELVLVTDFARGHVDTGIILLGLVHGLLDHTDQDFLAQQIHNHFNLGRDFSLGFSRIHVDHFGLGVHGRQVGTNGQQSDAVSQQEARQILLLAILVDVEVGTTLGGTRGHPQGLTQFLAVLRLGMQLQSQCTTVRLLQVGQGNGCRVKARFNGTTTPTNGVFFVGNGVVGSEVFEERHLCLVSLVWYVVVSQSTQSYV